MVTCYNSLNVTNGGTVSVFLGNGDGTFAHHADYLVNHHPVAVVGADRNGDGALDLAATVNDAGTAAILLNNGDGTFQAPVSYGASNGPYGVAVGDFNGDGKSDLAVTNYCTVGQSPLVCTGSYIGTVSVLRGNGDGAFQTASRFPVGVAPNGIAAAALSAGGNLDLLVTDNSDGSVLVFLGKGDGTFKTCKSGACNFFVDRNGLLRGTLPGELTGLLETLAAELLCQGRVLHHFPDGTGERILIVRRKQYRSVAGDFGQAGSVAAQDGRPNRHRFQHGESEAFIQRRHHQHAGVRV